jgi:hypothetical protein
MINICTRTEYADRLGLSHNMITQWLKAGKIGGPAIRGDGMVDVAAADQWLLDQPSISAKTKQRILDLRASGETLTDAGAGSSRAGHRIKYVQPQAPVPEPHILQINRAKAMTALVDAERARRKLEEERGRYVLADEIAATWSRGLTDLMTRIEFGLGRLERELAADREQIAVIRTWWRETRQKLADDLITPAPEFVTDRARQET